MARTALFSIGLAALVAWNWARLEHPHPSLSWLALMIALGVAPALVPYRRWRPWAGAVGVFVAASVALEVYRPWAVGRLASRGTSGFLDFYDVLVPFDRTVHPLMHGVVLLAVCVFSLLCALAVASRRPVAATFALVAGAGWPATIRPGSDDILRGAVLLGAALVLVAWLKPGARRAPPQVLAGTALVLAALILSSSSAIARSQFVGWQNWDFYNRPDKPVSVEYVWRANYKGIHFPVKRTRVLTVHAPERSAYWRVTTLDSFADNVWDQDPRPVSPPRVGGQDLLTGDILLPERARNPALWTRVDVRIDALRDYHLAGPTGPVAYDVTSLRDSVLYEAGGIAVLPRPASRNDEYTVWGYQPQPTPAQLARVRADYPLEIAYGGLYLTVDRGRAVPPFGFPGRADLMRREFSSYPGMAPYKPLYETARRIAGKAKNPYAATVALEAWLRSGGGFTYDETPPQVAGMPPLVAFVTKTKRGYCQHFAGAMALMLRYLGIPARVAAGFTSGNYDTARGTWRVYDRNAHTWVEVWFPGYGWLSFDPTPGRGNLGGPYTSSSISFDALGAEKVLAASALAAKHLLRFELGHPGKPGRGDLGPALPGDIAKGRGGGSSANGGGTAGIVLVSVIGLALLFVAFKLVRRRRRYLTGDPRRIAGACRRELVEYLLDQGADVPSSASLAELRNLVRRQTGVDPRAFVDAVGLARFGPASIAPTAARSAKRELRAVRRRLRRAVPIYARVRGLVSPRSLIAGS
jgi:transglutaminase-like putative cysteine protease